MWQIDDRTLPAVCHDVCPQLAAANMKRASAVWLSAPVRCAARPGENAFSTVTAITLFFVRRNCRCERILTTWGGDAVVFFCFVDVPREEMFIPLGLLCWNIVCGEIVSRNVLRCGCFFV